MSKKEIEKKEYELEVESYIANVTRAGQMCIRKAFRRQGIVKISTLTQKEIEEYTKNRESAIKEELDILKKQEQLRKHLAKLRELRYGRKRIL